jgi:glyoxylase-like metal-dependent hydrolase (beta-lactamase superfamily II)
MNRKALCRSLVFAVLAATFVWTAEARAQQPASPPVREISKIAGEVYRFRNNAHYSVFAVTPSGIIATDPINAEAAGWLKAELRKRFNQPVRYLIYSHDHADHSSGGEVFADTAIVVAQENAKRVIVEEKRPTAVPMLTFSSGTLTIELGGTVAEVIYLGKNHSDNSVVVRFPKEKVLFAVDFIPVKSLPFRNFPDTYLDETLASLKWMEGLDFDILAPGHGNLGDKSDVRAVRGYLEELKAEVTQYAREGKTPDEMKTLITMSKYSSWQNYKEYLPLNIEGMYCLVQAHRRPNDNHAVHCLKT